jgi:hypothetical protein
VPAAGGGFTCGGSAGAGEDARPEDADPDGPPEKVLAERGFLELADGPAPEPHPAWAILDSRQLVLIRADGSLEMVAESINGAYRWQAAAVAAPPHALAGTGGPIIYLLEGNRTLDIDRVIAIEALP